MDVPIYLIDPKPVNSYRDVIFIQKVATEGCEELRKIILNSQRK
jgi:hypothetical protein